MGAGDWSVGDKVTFVDCQYSNSGFGSGYSNDLGSDFGGSTQLANEFGTSDLEQRNEQLADTSGSFGSSSMDDTVPSMNDMMDDKNDMMDAMTPAISPTPPPTDGVFTAMPAFLCKVFSFCLFLFFL